jgi:hypothetical protein
MHLILCMTQAEANIQESRVVEILGYCHVCEDGGTAYESENKLPLTERRDFLEWFKNTEDPVAAISRLVADDSQRATAIVIAAEELDDQHFYRVSLNALQRFADGKAGQNELQRVLMPGEEKRGLLAVNYRDSVLQSTLKRCLDRGIVNPSYASYATAILSGQGAKDVIEYQDQGFAKRYVGLAEKALKNQDVLKRASKPRPWLQQLTATAPEVGTGWFWFVVITAVTITTCGIYKIRSRRI